MSAFDPIVLPAAMASALDSIIDSVVVTNQVGKIVYYNPASQRMFGFTQDEVIGRNVNILMPNPYKDHHDSWLRKYQLGGVPRLIGIPRVLKGERKDGSIFPLEISLGPIHHGQNTKNDTEERLFIAIMRDRTSPMNSSDVNGFKEDAELRRVLEENGMGQYMEVFNNEEITMKQFIQLTKDDLNSLGIIKMGARLKMQELIESSSELAQRQQMYLQHQAMDHTLEGTKHASRYRTAPASQTMLASSSRTQSSSSSVSSLSGVIHADELVFGELIGQGGFGVVYTGTCREVNVAIKKLMINCQQEAELMSRVRHRNVIQCYGACIEPPDFFLVMELAVCNLKQAIKVREVPPACVVDWAMQIAQGMDYLHTGAPRPIIHRDLKPGNVLLFDDGSLKISDFGLSRVRGLHDGTEKMSSVGTFEYMAPEVIKSEPYSEKADVYSYGVLVWEILIKQSPYAGLPSLAIAFGVGSGNLKLPIPTDCPKTFATLMAACWRMEYAKRPPFREIIRTLEKEEDSEFVRESPLKFLELQAVWETEVRTSIGRSRDMFDSEGFHTPASSTSTSAAFPAGADNLKTLSLSDDTDL